MDANLKTNESEIDTSPTICTEPPLTNHQTPPRTINQLNNSENNLCFISYRGANTVRPKWYLVEIRQDDDKQISEKNEVSVAFFRKHANDDKKKDNVARYWPEWYDIVWCDKDKSCFDYGRPVLVRPNQTPFTKKHCRFSNAIDFTK